MSGKKKIDETPKPTEAAKIVYPGKFIREFRLLRACSAEDEARDYIYQTILFKEEEEQTVAMATNGRVLAKARFDKGYFNDIRGNFTAKEIGGNAFILTPAKNPPTDYNGVIPNGKDLKCVFVTCNPEYIVGEFGLHGVHISTEWTKPIEKYNASTTNNINAYCSVNEKDAANNPVFITFENVEIVIMPIRQTREYIREYLQ